MCTRGCSAFLQGMTSSLAAFRAECFRQLERSLTYDWAIRRQLIGRVGPMLEHTHRTALGLCCAATILGARSPRGEFAMAVPEAAHLSLVLSLKGQGNAAHVLLRQTIELAMKHIYYANHPVEYTWVDDAEWARGLTFQKLLEYLRRTPEARALACGDRVCTEIGRWFGCLSRHVHVASRRHMRFAALTYRPSSCAAVFLEFARLAERVWPLLTVELVVHFADKFRAAGVLEQRLVVRSLPRWLRSVVAAHLAATIR